MKKENGTALGTEINGLEVKILYAFAFIVCCFHIAVFFKYTADDSFISFRYIANFVNGEGLVFNPGEYIEGYSNFLWVMILSVTSWLNFNLVLTSKVLGVLSLLGIYFFSVKILNKILGENYVYSFGLLYLLICNWSLSFYASSGMETVFYSFLVVSSVYLFIENNMRLNVKIIICLLMVALTRPEGIIYFVGFAAYDYFINRDISKKKIVLLSVFVVCYGLFLAWRFNYYGLLVPHTFYAKAPTRPGHGSSTGFIRLLVGGMDELVEFVQSTGGIFFLVLTILSIFLSSNKKEVFFLFYVFLVGLFFLKFAGGDWMIGYRFLLPVLPLYLVSAVIGFKKIAGCITKLTFIDSSAKAKQLAILLVIFLIGTFNLNETYKFIHYKGAYPNFIMTSEDLIGPSKWVGNNYPPDYTIAILRMGAMAYYSKLNIIDTFGLTDRYIGEMKYKKQYNKEVLDAYLAKRKPELIMLGYKAAINSEKLFGETGYKAVKNFKQGNVQSWTLYERIGI